MSTKVGNFDSHLSLLYKAECASLHNDFKRLRGHESDSDLRSKVFCHLKKISQAKNQDLSGLGDDRCLINAEKIVKGVIFYNHPGSQGRLVPLANAYIKEFSALQESSTQLNPDVDVFEDGLSQFFALHKQFVKAYCAEVKEVYKHEPNIVKITQPHEIDLFVAPFLEALRGCPIERIEYYLDKIVSCDPAMVFLFSYLVIEKSLLTEGRNLPKVFDSYRSKITEHSKKYCSLTEDEQASIHSFLMGDDIVPTEVAKKEIDLIKEWAIESQRESNHTALYSALMSNAFSSAEKGLLLARQMKTVMASLPEETHIKFSNACLFVLFCGITLEEESRARFEFFNQKTISILSDRYFKLSERERESIRNAAAGLERLAARTPESEFLIDLEFYSNKLAFSNDSGYLLKICSLCFQC